MAAATKDFDEYEYLEKAVEKPDKAVNGGGSVEKERSRSSKHRRSGDEDGDRDSERRPKQSRSEDRSGRDRHREKDRDRESSRHRSPDRREKDRHRERDRAERDKDRERDRDKEKNREREKERNRERENERDKEKEREKEMDAEKERDRSRRSRSHSERRRDEELERHQERSKEQEFRERDRESRRYKDKKEDAPEPEADPERDQRTVFAYQLSLKADERDVFEFFSRAGKVRDVRLIMDRNSRRSKGVGYIEFYDVMSVPMAIALSGQLLLGQPVMVKPSEAEKNLVQSNAAAGVRPWCTATPLSGKKGSILNAAAGAAAGPQSGVARRLYVGNLHMHITEEQLRQVFESFGQVELVQLPLDPLTGQCKGYGFVQFARLEDARAALSLNGQLEIAGRTIKVSAVTDQTGVQDVATNSADLDDDEGGGLSLNARSRALLMQKLDRTGIASSVAGAIGAPTVTNPLLSVPTAPALGAPLVSPVLLPGLAGLQVPTASAHSIEAAVPSECLLLKNMFDPSLETEPDFDLDIKDDVQDECSKFGPLNHIFVDKNSAGHVYLRFDNANSAMSAQRALHGRWFAGKMITASFMLPQQYEAKFSSKA